MARSRGGPPSWPDSLTPEHVPPYGPDTHEQTEARTLMYLEIHVAALTATVDTLKGYVTELHERVAELEDGGPTPPVLLPGPGGGA